MKFGWSMDKKEKLINSQFLYLPCSLYFLSIIMKKYADTLLVYLDFPGKTFPYLCLVSERKITIFSIFDFLLIKFPVSFHLFGNVFPRKNCPLIILSNDAF